MKKMTRKIATVLIAKICFTVSTVNMLANETTKPLELPAFIIEGVEQHNLRSSIKRMPARPSVLNQSELDSLNTFEKQQPALLPTEELPSYYLTKQYSKGYLKGSYGLFNTPALAAGYGFYLDRFDIFANVGLQVSGGDAVNSEYNKFFVDVSSNYIADEKFFIFGGSSTRTGFLINSQDYNFYGYAQRPRDTDYYDRNLFQGKFYVVSDGAHENILFSVGGSANYINAKNNSKAINNISNPVGNRYAIGSDINNIFVDGFLTIKNYWKNFLLAGNVMLNFESVGGNSLNYYQFDGSASYFDENISILARAGIQIANNSANTSRGGLLLLGNIEYRMNKLFTVKAEVSSGLEKTNFEEIIKYNPYLSTRAFIDHRYDIANIKGALLFHPNEKIAIMGGIDLRYADRNLVFVTDTLAQFKLEYINGTVNDIFGEILWNFTDADRFIAKVNFNINHLADSRNLTYTPPFKSSGTYYRKWFNRLGTFVTANIVGAKDVATVNNSKQPNRQINSYFSLDLGADYTLKKFNIFAKINNLTNSEIYFWDGYRERGMFGSLGLMWHF